ncbi:MAG: VOC family protein [Candidatus Zixiibacteriota bacterium]|nr:MAG: VOC family protein [candidate division Zixibacteria bacterium]
MSETKFPHGTFCWNELMTRDVPAAAKFYSELLGWEAADSGMPGMKYTVFKIAGKDAGGLMEMPAEIPKEVPDHWMTYIAVADIDAVVKKTLELGGTVLHGPQEVPGVGRFAVIQDPTGAVVSLIQ